MQRLKFVKSEFEDSYEILNQDLIELVGFKYNEDTGDPEERTCFECLDKYYDDDEEEEEKEDKDDS